MHIEIKHMPSNSLEDDFVILVSYFDHFKIVAKV
jgi:hypothetical protein